MPRASAPAGSAPSPERLPPTDAWRAALPPPGRPVPDVAALRVPVPARPASLTESPPGRPEALDEPSPPARPAPLVVPVELPPPRLPRPPRRRREGPVRAPSGAGPLPAPPPPAPAPSAPAAPAARMACVPDPPPVTAPLGSAWVASRAELSRSCFPPAGDTGSDPAGAGRESPILGRGSAGGRRSGWGAPGALGATVSASAFVRRRGAEASRGSTAPSAARFTADGRSWGVSPGTRSAGPGGPVIESDIGKIPSRGRARARRAHPAGGWRRAQHRGGAPAWGTCISDDHSVRTRLVVAAGTARDGMPVQQGCEDGADAERGSHQRGLGQSRRCHPSTHPTAVATTYVSQPLAAVLGWRSSLGRGWAMRY